MIGYKITHKKRLDEIIPFDSIEFKVSESVKELWIKDLLGEREHIFNCTSRGKEEETGKEEEMRTLTRIQEFWKWWNDYKLEISADIALQEQSSILMKEMRRKIAQIHPELEFQFSPGRNGSLYSLIFCGGLDPHLRVLQEKITLLAPEPCYHFCYFPCLQPYDRDPHGMIFYSGKGVRLQLRHVRWHVKLRSKRKLLDIKCVYFPISAKLFKNEEKTVIFHLLNNLLGDDGLESYIGSVSHRVKYVDCNLSFPDHVISTRQLLEMVSTLHKHSKEESYQVSKITLNSNGLLLGYSHLNVALKHRLFLLHNLYCSLVFKMTDHVFNDDGDKGIKFSYSMIEDLKSRFPSDATIAIRSWSSILNCGTCEFFSIDTPLFRQIILEYVTQYENKGWKISIQFVVDINWDRLDTKVSGLLIAEEIKKLKDTIARHTSPQGPSPQIKSIQSYKCPTCKKIFFRSTKCPFCMLDLSCVEKKIKISY
jgi:hypothetical protein